MTTKAYYNEFDPFAAAWLRELIKAGCIAPGDVDERSIEDVRPSDLAGYTQCHFFAGIGVWSYALRRAGWADDRPVWTGSCPCQPFSAAGKGGGFADERHLWPAFHHLIRECGPRVVFGEQVASKDGLGWLDLVQADLEGSGYACGAVDLCAAGVGAPHIRQRLWWVADRMADTDHPGRQLLTGREPAGVRGAAAFAERGLLEFGADSASVRGLADASGAGLPAREREAVFGEGRRGEGRAVEQRGCASGRLADANPFGRARVGGCRENGASECRDPGGLADAALCGCGEERSDARRLAFGDHPEGFAPGSGSGCGDFRTGPVNGLWRDADWLFCRDGKWRPVEPRAQSLVDGSAESLGRVRPGQLEDLELEIAEWSIRHQTDAREALLDLRSSLSEEALRGWPVGGLPDLHEAPILLAFLRQLSEQGWAFAECVPSESTKAAQERLRVLWGDGEAARTPCERGLDGQPPGERADALRLLSSVLARHAQEAWGRAYESYAAAGFPLAHGARSRVGRLRGYGNAINAEAATEVIEAYLEARVYRDLDLCAERVRLIDGVFS